MEPNEYNYVIEEKRKLLICLGNSSRNRIKKVKVVFRLVRRNWTEEEIDYLINNVGQIKVTTIANNLNRTEPSVLLKMNRMGLGNTREKAGHLTIGELARLLKVERNIVCGWSRNHGLKCMKKVTRSLKKFWFVDSNGFWEWAEKNKDKIDFSKIDLHSIPPEPPWVKIERLKTKSQGQYKSWTINEEKKLLHLISHGKSFEEAGKQLERTKYSVEKKYKRICIR